MYRILSYFFGPVRVEANLETHETRTFFPDGTWTVATPRFNSALDREEARRLGYGGHVAALTRENQILHSWLAEKLHMVWSPTLWAVAHNQQPDAFCLSQELQENERQLVVAFQQYLNTAERQPVLQVLSLAGLDLPTLRWEATTLLNINNLPEA
jgi:hypothetical protein